MTKKVLVGGCFDILHYGHIVFLQHARLMGDSLVVALEPDRRIHSKNREAVHTQEQRARILESLRFVDEVICLPWMETFEDYLDLVRNVSPGIIAVTAGDPQLHHKEMQATIVGARVEVVTPLLTGFSSTEIMHRLCS